MSVTTVFTGPKHQADPLCDELRYNQGLSSAFVYPAELGIDYDLKVNVGHKNRALEVLAAVLNGHSIPERPTVLTTPIAPASATPRAIRPLVEHLPDRPIACSTPAVQCGLFDGPPTALAIARTEDVLYSQYREYLEQCRLTNSVADNVSDWMARNSERTLKSKRHSGSPAPGISRMKGATLYVD